MPLPARQMEQLGRAQGLVQPLRITEGITSGDLARTLTDAGKEASQRLQRAMTLGKGGLGTRQLEAMTKGLGSLSASMWGAIGAQVRMGVYDAAELAATQGLDRDFLLGMPFKAIQQYAPEVMLNAFQGAEDVISRHTNGFNLSDRIYRNGQATVMKVGQIIDRGLVQQLSPAQLARQVRGYFDPAVPGGASYAANRLARTEINNAHHDTTIRLTKDQPWVDGYQWQLSRSHPKPDVCDALASGGTKGDGIYDKLHAPSKPHPQCFCYLLIVQPSNDEFMNKLTQGKYDEHLEDLGVHC